MTQIDNILMTTILALPEWMIYGSSDSPRCLWCGGFKHRDSALLTKGQVVGHQKNCKRQIAIRIAEEK